MKKKDISILCVEDDPLALKTISAIIARRFEKVITATNGKEGLEKFIHHKPEIILTDVAMPEKDGLQMAKEIMELDPDVRIIIMSAYSETEYFLKAIELGVDNFTLKPTDTDKLLSVLQKTAASILMERKVEQQKIELIESEEKYRTTVNNLPLAILSLNADGLIISANPIFETIFEIEEKDYLSKKKIFDFYFFDQLEKDNCHRNLVNDDVPFDYETPKIILNSGKEIYLRCRGISFASTKPQKYLLLLGEISTRKLAEISLKEKETEFSNILNSITELIFLMDKNDNYKAYYGSINDELYSKPEHFIGKHYSEIMPYNFVNLYEKAAKLVRENGEPENIEYPLDIKDERKWFSAQIDLHEDGESLVITARNISQRKRAEQRLQRSEARYLDLFDNAPDMYFSVSPSGSVISVNKSGAETLGYSQKELIGNQVWGVVYKDDLQKVQEEFTRIISEKVNGAELNFRKIRKNGSVLHVHEKTNLTFDKKGEVKEIRILCRDTTEKVIARQELKKSEQRYQELYKMLRLMTDTVPDMIWTKDMNGLFTFTNKTICEKLLNAKDTKEPIGKHTMFFVNRERENHPENKDWFTFGEACADSDAIVHKTKKLERFDEYGNVFGKFLFLDVFKAPIYNKKGKMIGTVGSARDITETKKLEKERKLATNRISKAKQEWEETFDSITDYIMILNKHMQVIRVNKILADKLGMKPDNLIGRDCCELFHDSKCIPGLCPMKKLLKDGKIHSETFYEKKLDGYLLSTLTPLKDNDGKIVGAVSISKNITEMKEKEAILRFQQEHIKLINKILRHDLSNNLAVIKSAINIFKEEKNETILDEAVKRCFTSVNLIRKMKDLETVISSDKKFKSIDVSSIVKELSANYPAIKIDVSGQATIKADDTFGSVLDNLLKNAVEHGRASRIKIELKQSASECEIKIIDNGVGIPDEIKNNIFEEGFKFGKKGHTGLGLFIVKNAVMNYGGTVKVDDNDISGTVFVMKLKRWIEE